MSDIPALLNKFGKVDLVFTQIRNIGKIINSYLSPRRSEYLLVSDDLQITRIDSFLKFKLISERDFPAHQIEQGSFSVFNKSSKPTVLNITAIYSDIPERRSAVIRDLLRAQDSLRLITVVTPTNVYYNYQIKTFIYELDSNDSGDYLLMNLTLVEILQKAESRQLIDQQTNVGTVQLNEVD